MGRRKKMNVPNLRRIERKLKQAQREQIKEGLSDMFKEMGLHDTSLKVLEVKTKRQFDYYLSVARGWFKSVGGTASKKTKEALALLKKLERMW